MVSIYLTLGAFWSSWYSSWKLLRDGYIDTFFPSCTIFSRFTKHLRCKKTFEINFVCFNFPLNLLFCNFLIREMFTIDVKCRQTKLINCFCTHLTLRTFWSCWHSSWKLFRDGCITFFLSCTTFNRFTKFLRCKRTPELNNDSSNHSSFKFPTSKLS